MGALDSVSEVSIEDSVIEDSAEEHSARNNVNDRAKSGAGKLRGFLTRWWVAFWLSSVCVVSGHLMIKAGLNALTLSGSATSSFAGRIAHTLMQPEVVGGLLVYGFGTVCWMIAVSQKDISFLFPLSSVNYVLVVAASALLFGEVIPAKRALGVALIVVGMIVLNRKQGREQA